MILKTGDRKELRYCSTPHQYSDLKPFQPDSTNIIAALWSPSNDSNRKTASSTTIR